MGKIYNDAPFYEHVKRKVIQLAGKTLVVSLPNAWARKYNVKKGDEVEVEETDNKLIIGQDKDLFTDAVKIDVSGLSEIAVSRILGAAYKSGYDEATITFTNQSELEALLLTIRESFIGFEIVSRTPCNLIIRNVAVIQYGEFETILRRIFLVTLSMADDGLEAIRTRNELLMRSVVFMDKDINKYANFCRRILNKKGYSTFRKTPPLYYIVEQLEKLGDALRDICIAAQSSKPPKKEVIALHARLCKLIRMIYELYYKFDKNKVSAFFTEWKQLKESIFTALKTKDQDVLYLLQLAIALEDCFEISGPLITLNL